MSEHPNNNGRESDGTFAPGNKLGGSKAGSRHRVTRAIEALLDGQHEALTLKAIEKPWTAMWWLFGSAWTV